MLLIICWFLTIFCVKAVFLCGKMRTFATLMNKTSYFDTSGIYTTESVCAY